MTPEELRDALAPIETQLRRLADLIALMAMPADPQPEAPTCPHPESQRLMLGASGTSWQCQLCDHLERPPMPVD